MDWIESGTPATSRLTVENRSGSTQTVTAGCRTKQEVLFTASAEVSPGEAVDVGELPDEAFEVGVRVDGDGPEAAKTYTAPEALLRVTATVTDSEITFSPDESTGGTTPANPPENQRETTSGDRRTESGDADTGRATADTRQAASNAEATSSGADATTADTESDAAAGRSPGPGEVYCRNCGEVIERRAEYCTACGVRNAAYDPPEGRRGASDVNGNESESESAGTSPAAGSDAAQTSSGSPPTNVGRFGVVFSTVLWAAAGALLLYTLVTFQAAMASPIGRGGGALRSMGVATLIPVVQVAAWVLLPVSLYLDLRYISFHTDDWPLHGKTYLAATIVLPALTQVFGAVALFLDGATRFVAVVIPLVLVLLCVRHLRTKKRVLA